MLENYVVSLVSKSYKFSEKYILTHSSLSEGLAEPPRTLERIFNFSTHALYFCKALLTVRGQMRSMPMPTVVISIVFSYSQLFPSLNICYY